MLVDLNSDAARQRVLREYAIQVADEAAALTMPEALMGREVIERAGQRVAVMAAIDVARRERWRLTVFLLQRLLRKL